MNTRKACLVLMVLMAFSLNACGTSSTIPPGATSLPPTATPVPPTVTMTPEPTSTLPPTPTPSIGSIIVSEKDSMVSVFVPAGEFTMGSKLYKPERPEHNVYLDAFWIDKTEVTNEMFVKFLNENLSQITIDAENIVNYENHFIYGLVCLNCGDWTDRITWDGSQFSTASGYENHPAAIVTWYGADSYCKWAGRRLPTEAEWEKAARGPDGRMYPWGDTMPNESMLNFDDKVGTTTEVGKYPEGASVYGALDIAGNVQEWVNDWYDEAYYQNSPISNPLGPDSGVERAIRDTGWYDIFPDARSSARLFGQEPNTLRTTVGFRCALSE